MAELKTYIIKGGEQGKARMAVIARVLAPATATLLDRFDLAGKTVVDAGCGGGEISFELARRVGPSGRVIGIDLDDAKLALAREEAASRGLGNVEFRAASVLDPWPVENASLVLIRFVLTHLTTPETMLSHARAALRSGGIVAVEDIDYAGQFCDPPFPVFDRYGDLYVAAAQKRGVDPFIGRRLVRLLEGAGFSGVEAALAQPFGRTGDVKQVASLTFGAISDALKAAGLATAEEIAGIAAALDDYAQDAQTTMSFPRIFQAWGSKA
jgi:ubiquinone/menaquinone biosynthesis C-methylase UbiE